MQKKRILALVFVMTMMISTMLAGCGQQGNEVVKSTENSKVQESSQDSQVMESSEEVAELEEKTIQIWLYGRGKQKDSEEVWDVFNEKLQEYVPNTTVEFTVMSTSEYKEKYSQMMASGEPVDLAWSAGWVVGRSQDDEARDGNILPLDDLLDEYGQGIKEELGDTILDMHRYSDGKLYYIISWQGLFEAAYGYRVPTELAKLAGDSWVDDTQAAVTKYYSEEYSLENYQAVFDQFDKYFAAVKDAGKLYSGVDPGFCFAGWGLNTYTSPIAAQNNTGVLRRDDTFTVVDFVQTEHYRLYAQNMAEYYNKGYYRSDIASWDRSSVSFVKNGEYGPNTLILYCHNLLTESARNDYEKDAGVDLEYITFNEQGQIGKGTATSMVIPYCADEPERAMMVYNAIYTEPELYQLLVYGIEGKHYTDNGDGTITTPYGGSPLAESDYGQWKWIFGTCKNSLVTQADSPGYYDQLIEKEKTAYVSPFINFSFDNSAVADIVSALNAIDSEYSVIISSGYMGEEWEVILDKWIAERKAAGVDKLIEEFQKQLDAYIEANGITSW